MRTLLWLTVFATGSWMLGPSHVAFGQTDTAGVDAGSVVVVDTVNSTRELTEGDSRTAFSLRLPDGSACPGDSANDDWRVQSFLVPADTDIGSLRYRALRPDGDAYRALRYPNGDIFTQAFTDPNPGPGSPGRILAVPPLTFAWFPAGSIPPGRYKIGIACTPPSWEVARFWDAEIELEEAADVEPGGLRWRVLADTDGAVGNGADEGISNGDRALWTLIGVGTAGVLAAILLVRRRTSHSASPIAKDVQ